LPSANTFTISIVVKEHLYQCYLSTMVLELFYMPQFLEDNKTMKNAECSNVTFNQRLNTNYSGHVLHVTCCLTRVHFNGHLSRWTGFIHITEHLRQFYRTSQELFGVLSMSFQDLVWHAEVLVFQHSQCHLHGTLLQNTVQCTNYYAILHLMYLL